MGALNLILTDKGERRLLYAALGRLNKHPISTSTVPTAYKSGELRLRLFSNDVTAGKSTVSSGLTESTASGYSEIVVNPIDFVSKTADSDTTNTVYSKEYTFDFTGAGTIYGAYVVEPDAYTAVANVDTIVAEADVSGALGGKTFLFWNTEEGYYVWFNTGASTDPEVEFNNDGLNPIEVAITTDDTAVTIGGLVRTAITNADCAITVSGTGANIILTNDETGGVAHEAQDEEDNGTGWSSFTNTTEGLSRLFSGTHELSKLVCTAGTSLDGKYWAFTTVGNDGNDYAFYIWYNTGASTDPEPGGYIMGIEVEVNTGDTAAQIATKTNTAISGSFITYGIVPIVLDDDTLYVESLNPSSVAQVAAGDSGFTVTQLVDSSDTGVVWFAGNFPSPITVADGDDIKINLQLTLN